MLEMSRSDRERMEGLNHQELLAHFQASQMLSFFPNFVTVFLTGVIYVGAVEGLAWVIRHFWPAGEASVAA